MVSYCKNCGRKLKEGAFFCAGCGTQLGEVQVPDASPISDENNAEQAFVSKDRVNFVIPKAKAKMNFINVKTVSALIIIVLLAGTYFFVGRMFTPESVSEAFIDAVIAEDIHKVRDYINEGQIEIKASDDQAKEFIQYLNGNPRLLSELAVHLEAESSELSSGEEVTATYMEPGSIANLKREGKKLLLFNHYIIEVKPYYAAVTSTQGNTEIHIDEEPAITMEANVENTVGPFLPGEHQVKAVINGEFGPVERTVSFDGANMTDRTVYITFEWSDAYLDFYTDYSDAILFINGNSTGKLLEDYDWLGPLPKDGSIKLHAERQFTSGTKVTEPVVVDPGTNDVALLFNYEEEASYPADSYTYEALDTPLPVADIMDDQALIEDTIYNHYSSITNDDFQQAFDLFSAERKNSVTLEQWSKGFQTNRSDNVGIVSVTEINGETAIAYVEMTSYDDKEDGSTLVQEWAGNWHLLKEEGRWVLSKAKLEKLSARTE